MKIRQAVVVALVGLAASWAGQAVAGERNYFDYPTGYFWKVSANKWVEKAKDGSASWDFVETDRTENFVELYDKSRDCTIRLRSDQSRIRPASGEPFQHHQDGQFIDKPGGAGERGYFDYSTGYFIKVSGKNWLEKSKDGQVVWNFVETDRTGAYVELYDKSRDCTIRLRNDQSRIRPQGGQPFEKHQDGQWVDRP